MDALGQEIQPGDFVVYTSPRSSGFRITIVKTIGNSRIKLVDPSYGPSRKDLENIIVVTEEQLISMKRRGITINENGMVSVRDFIGYSRETGQYEYDEREVAPEERLAELVRPYIQLSKMVKGEALEGEYEPTPEELEKLEKSLNKR